MSTWNGIRIGFARLTDSAKVDGMRESQATTKVREDGERKRGMRSRIKVDQSCDGEAMYTTSSFSFTLVSETISLQMIATKNCYGTHT